MSDEALRDLAGAAGIQVDWTDNAGAARSVSPGTQRAVLASLGFESGTAQAIAASRARLAAQQSGAMVPPLITAIAGEPVELLFRAAEGARARIEFEQGGAADCAVECLHGAARLGPVTRPGYHRLWIAGRALTLAVAPKRAWTAEDAAPGEKLWGLTAQVHGLRRAGDGQGRAGDGGIGDFGAVAQLAARAAQLGASALSLSPTHALFCADDRHFTPYSPSSRLFHNILLADPEAIFDSAAVAGAAAGLDSKERARLEASGLIDWPQASRAKKALLRTLFDGFNANELRRAADPMALDFQRFRAAGGRALEQHAAFEAIHTLQFGRDPGQWHWRGWPAELRDSAGAGARAFAAALPLEITWHVYLQWLADRSLARAQQTALCAGMRIGLIADLAVGMNAGGSHAWASPQDLLAGLSIGAPPDPLAPRGQNWGLVTFSPQALIAGGFAPFLATLRAAMRHAGGVRIDHVMGISRLWLTPDGMDASQGAYVAYPAKDMLRLIALESSRHRALVIGEDLGTVPHGLRDELADAGLYGMRVLPFERHHGGFNPPDWYPPGAAAMTSTHDTATVAGWWSGADLETRARIDQLPPGQSLEAAAHERSHGRSALWSAFQAAGAASQAAQPAPDEPGAAVDAAVAFMARTPANLVFAPLEDALGLIEQPNLPGTTDEHPNWRRRYPGPAADCLDRPGVAERLRPLSERR